ncbi:uncharacterized protein CD98hc isoform X2 [Epargyreus clarus]|uniref:uncharacterized protein CD98hc isoform X2 n=1 Tax=Epargyreus clarus TaxID=520877 RepID=UPI003C2BDFB4
MAEPRKNHLSIDGGQVKDDDHVASYKPIPDSDTVPEFRTSKSSLSKSKEKVSADGAEEKLLSKEDEAKIITRVDMADAKYVVGDHRNGDAKIELDANKRQFTGLTKEELMKYADDPFWVRLRWFMFILFWALWLCMLAGAIVIIVQAPKCVTPPPRTWYEKGPLVDGGSLEDYTEIEVDLPQLQRAKVAGIIAFTTREAYAVLDDPTWIDRFKKFVDKAKEYGLKVIVDLTANYVYKTHKWFQLSENSTDANSEYHDYFIWRPGTGFEASAGSDPGSSGDKPQPKKPNNWVSTRDEPAWTYSPTRGEFYLHQFGADRPDLNMSNPNVVKRFDAVLDKWMKAGAYGVRLRHGRELLVDPKMENELENPDVKGAVHTQYAYWRHNHTSDRAELHDLFAHWAHRVDNASSAPGAGETVFMLAEKPGRAAFESPSLRPPAAAAIAVRDAAAAAADLARRLTRWPAIQLTSDDDVNLELASFSLLLPAAPVLDIDQFRNRSNAELDTFAQLVDLRNDPSVQHGEYAVQAVPAANSTDQMLACARWKAGNKGYLAVYNPQWEAARARLQGLALPADLTAFHPTPRVTAETGYTNNKMVNSEEVMVPARSTVIFSYVPKKEVEN